MSKNIKTRGIIPRRLKGFRDIDALTNELRWHIIKNAETVYKQYGFEHWDTPILEYVECLGKHMPPETGQASAVQDGVFHFQNLEFEPVCAEDGTELKDADRNTIMERFDVLLRYDLTAPLARRIAETLWQRKMQRQLQPAGVPLFRRYQYGPVYRLEAKLEPGRFREFWQLDFDTVGTNDYTTDAECCMILADALQAIGLNHQKFTVKVNNRKILKGLLQMHNITTEQAEADILRVIDKLDKIGLENVKSELSNGRKDASGSMVKGLGLPDATVQAISGFFAQYAQINKNRKAVLQSLSQQLAQSSIAAEGIAELQAMDAVWCALNYTDDLIVFDPSFVRGMAYYTGPIFEVEAHLQVTDEKGQPKRFGSIAGGGRYDTLVAKLLNIAVPAVGASIGVDRLGELLLLSGTIKDKLKGPVFIAVLDAALMPQYQKMAQNLRQNGIITEVYYGIQRKIQRQLEYADKRNCSVAILVGSNEIERGVVTIKDLFLGAQTNTITDKQTWMQQVQREVPLTDLVETVKEMLSS